MSIVCVKMQSLTMNTELFDIFDPEETTWNILKNQQSVENIHVTVPVSVVYFNMCNVSAKLHGALF